MANIGTLAAKLVLQTGDFTSGIAASQRALETLSRTAVAGPKSLPALTSGTGVIDAFRGGIEKLTKIPVISQIKDAFSWVNDKYNTFLENRYGKAAPWIKYSGMATDAMLTAGLRMPIPGMSIMGSIPAMLAAELTRLPLGSVVSKSLMAGVDGIGAVGSAIGRRLSAGIGNMLANPAALGTMLGGGLGGSMVGIGAAFGPIGLAVGAAGAVITKTLGAIVDVAKAAAVGIVSFAQAVTNGVNPLQAFLQASSGVLGAIPLVGGVLSSVAQAGAGFFGWVEQGANRAIEFGRIADGLGIPMERISGLMLFAGDRSEVFLRALTRLGHKLGEVRTGNIAAGDSFARLNLDAGQLAAMAPDQAFARIMDRIRQMPPGFERVAAASEVFGGKMEGLLPLLARGSEAMQKAQERASRGLGFGRSEFDALVQGQRAFDSIRDSMRAIQTQLAIQLAPWFRALGTWLEQSGINGVNWGQKVMRALEGVGVFIGTIIDLIRNMIATANVAANAVIGGIGGFAAAAANTAVGGGETTVATVRNWFAQMRALWKDAASQPGGGPNEQLQLMHQNMQQLINDLPVEKLRLRMGELQAMLSQGGERFKGAFAENMRKTRDEFLGTFGVDIRTAADRYQDAVANIERANRRGLLTAGDFAEAMRKAALNLNQTANLTGWEQSLGRFNDRLIQLRDLAGRGIRFTWGDEIKKAQQDLLGFDVRSPIERFQGRIMELDRWLQAGAIDANVYAQTISRAVGELEQAQHEENKAPAALLAGTKEAFSAIAAYERQGQTGNVQERIRGILERALQVQQQQLQAARETADAVRALPRPNVARL